MISTQTRLLLIALLLGLLFNTVPVQAQEDGEDESTEETASAWDWYGDLRLRYELTTDIPGRPDDLERGRAFLRTGLRFNSDNGWEFAGAVKLAGGTDDNVDSRRNNDNEISNDAELDELYASYAISESALFRVGKTAMPLVLSPLLWDRDLRPVGVSFEYSGAVRDFDALHFQAGYFAGDHLYGDESRISAIQFGYGWMEGADSGFSAFLSYLDFDDLEVFARQGLARTNRRVAGLLVSDYELLDLQLIGRTQLREKPLVARIDLVRNLGARDLDEGGRFSLVWGDAERLGGWELGYAYQRAQRDAVLAGFAEDDWWFHTFARGYMPWVAYGFNENWSAQATAFIERRDGLTEYTDRFLLDVRSRW